MRPPGTPESLLDSHQKTINNSTATQYSPLVGVILEINNLFYPCFVQHCSLKPPPCYTRTLPCMRPQTVFCSSPAAEEPLVSAQKQQLQQAQGAQQPGEHCGAAELALKPQSPPSLTCSEETVTPTES